MAYGIIKIIPNLQHVEIPLSGVAGGTDWPSIKVLNPNDGVAYIARNRDALSSGYGDWDWKVPSQSYAMLPGPFHSAGVYFLDQSGAGRQGEISVYLSTQKLDDPVFLAIGRALVAQQTTLDITEGAQPANPGAGILRLWADGTDLLHILSGSNVDAILARLPIHTADIAGGAVTTAVLAANAATQLAVVYGTADRSTSSLPLVDLDPALSITMTTTGGPVLVFWSGPGTASALFALSIDGIDGSILSVGNGGSAPFAWASTGIAAGVHTLKMRWRSQSGTANCSMATSQSGTFTVVELKR